MESETLWTAFGAAAIALVTLGWLDRSVSTGFRIYVLLPFFKAAWAAIVTVTAVILVMWVIGLLAGEHEAVNTLSPAKGLRILKILLALVTGISALGSLLPDWNPWTDVVAALVIVLWAVAAYTAATAPAKRKAESYQGSRSISLCNASSSDQMSVRPK